MRTLRDGKRLRVVLALVLGACGGGSDGAPPPPTTSTTSTSTTEAAGPSFAIDWRARTVTPATDGEWTIRFCEGEAPLLCLDRDGTNAGAVEVLTFPLDSFGGKTLEQIADDAVRTFQADRKEGCGTDYLVEADERRRQTVAGEADGLRSGWTARRQGKAVERNLTYTAVKGDTVVLIGAGALEPDANCLERLNEFRLEDLEAAEPTLDRLLSTNFDPRTTASGG